MDRAVESDRTAGSHGVDRIPAGNLVAKAGRATEMMPTHSNASPTLDVLFQRILARQPHALALLDPLNKQRVTGQAPKRLTFAQADRAISALAAHFIESGLPANSVIAVQLPNTIEFALTMLAAHRAGLIVAAGGIDGRAQSHRRAGRSHHEPDRWRGSRRHRHERGGGMLFDPPCLRL